MLQVRFLEVVDKMVGQIICRLWEAEQQQQQQQQQQAGGSVSFQEPQRFTIVVTGDHSTPVMFGDHSHEPVPFAVAHVRHVVSVAGRPSTRVVRHAWRPLLHQVVPFAVGNVQHMVWRHG